MPRSDRHEDEFDDDTPIRRRGRKAGFWTPVTISLVAGGGVLVVAGLVLVLLLRGGGGLGKGQAGAAAVAARGAEVEGKQWDCHQLVAYLNSRGLTINTEPDQITQMGQQFQPRPADEIHRAMSSQMILTSSKYKGVLACVQVNDPVGNLMHSVDPRKLQMVWGEFWFEEATDGDSLIRTIHRELPGSNLVRGPLPRRR